MQRDLATHAYLVVESSAPVQTPARDRVRRPASRRAAGMVEGIAAGLAAHDAAVGRWRRTGPRHLSVVDATSFVVMAARKIDRAFAFDHGFVRARLGLLA